MNTVQIQLRCHQCGNSSESVQFTGLFRNAGFWGGLSNESQPQNPEYGRDIGNIMVSMIYFDHSRLKILMSCTLTKIWIFKSSGFFQRQLSIIKFTLNYPPLSTNQKQSYICKSAIYAHWSGLSKLSTNQKQSFICKSAIVLRRRDT